MKLTTSTIDKLQTIFKGMEVVFSNLQDDRTRFEEIERYLQKTTDKSDSTNRGKAAKRAGLKDRISNIETPVTFIYKEVLHAYLTGTFLSGSPIFAAVADRQHEDVASMLTALSHRDELRFKWVGEFLKCLSDACSFPYFAAKVEWTAKRASAAQTTVSEDSPTTGTLAPVIYEGNSIVRIDPYNLIRDPSVPPHQVHSHGAFVGYVSQLNYIQVKERYLDWNAQFTIKKNIGKILSGEGAPSYSHLHFRPKVNEARSPYDPNNWPQFWQVPSVPVQPGKNVFEEFVLYRKIIPKEYDIHDVPSKGDPAIYKFIFINGHLAYVEPFAAGHEYLPIIVGQLYPGDPTNKSFVEYLTDLQDLATSLMTANLDAMRRAVGDRAIYNPRIIAKEDIEAPSPVSKIPMISNLPNGDIRSAYYQIPYNDTVSPQFRDNMGFTMQLAEETMGINKASQGSFIRGNKTMHEFSTIMSNAEARQQLGAFAIESYFFSPIKEIIKINYLIHAQNEEINNHNTQGTVEIDPVILRGVAPNFKMADGIMPATKLANTEVLFQALQLLVTDPMLHMEYDVGGIAISALKQQGFTDLNSYRRTPEQMQQYLAMMQMQAAQQNGAQTDSANQEQEQQ